MQSELSANANSQLILVAPATVSGMRVDKALAELLSDYSRATIQGWFKQGLIKIDGRALLPKNKLYGGEILRILIPPPPLTEMVAQPIDLDIKFADDDLLIINKPAGLVVHPGAGNRDQTLLNGLLHFDPKLRELPRAGIVHRLDKDTSGLLVVARNQKARLNLIKQLKKRDMKRVYIAVVNGILIAGETIEQPIGRHRNDRLRMCVTPQGKPATTRISIIKKYNKHCLVRAELLSGRTHQIRVHLSWRGFALVGDKIYGMRRAPTAHGALADTLKKFNRQALHAESLALLHPLSGELLKFNQPPPADLQDLIARLQHDMEQLRVK